MKTALCFVAVIVLGTGCDRGNPQNAQPIQTASKSGGATQTALRTFDCTIPAREALTISLLDSSVVGMVWNPMAESTTVHRVMISSASSRDTLANVLDPLPILVGDTLVAGLLLSGSGDEGQRAIFRFHGGCRKAELTPVPDEAHYIFHDVTVSPDGRYYAYVASDSTGQFGIVRDFGKDAPIVTTPGRGGCECDIDFNHTRWFAPDSFEIAVHLEEGGWQISSGRASARTIRVDTVSKEPTWH